MLITDPTETKIYKIIDHSLRWYDIEYDITPNINDENIQLKPTNINDTKNERKLKIFNKLKWFLNDYPS